MQVEDRIHQALDQRVRPVECFAIARYALAARAARAGSIDNEFTRIAIDRLQAYGDERIAEYLRMNPNSLVPTIEDDGFVLWESHSIVRYLAAKHSPGGLSPADLRQRADAERRAEQPEDLRARVQHALRLQRHQHVEVEAKGPDDADEQEGDSERGRAEHEAEAESDRCAQEGLAEARRRAPRRLLNIDVVLMKGLATRESLLF